MTPVHVRSPRSFFKIALASCFVIGLASEAVAAGGKDGDAQKLLKAAMDDDYLATEFAKAEKKLKEALTKCGNDCSAEMMGKIHIALGTVHGVGLSKLDAAKDDFIAALKADSKAALDASLTTPELTKVFEEAKKAVGGSGSGGKGGSDGDKPKKPPSESKAGHTPPTEQLVNTPVPVYFEPAADQAVKKASLRYKPFGAPKYKSIDMKPMGKGFGALIPCEEVTTTGDVKYYFVLTDESGDAAGTVGSADDPFKVPIKNEIEGAAPKLPGEKPPAQCKEKADCPPGLPGCPSGEKRGDKGWGASCEKNAECKEGYVCLNGTCEEGKGGDGAGGASGGSEEDKLNKSNMVGLWAQLDALIISGAEEVCNGQNASYICFDKGTSNQFFGNAVPQKGTNGIQGGFGVGGARLMLSYDRKIHKVTKGLTVGARIGFAFGGSPSPENQPPNGSLIGLAKGFLPVHAEVRVSYHFLGSMFQRMKVSPYAFIGGGLAQVNASVPVQVCDSVIRPGDKTGNGCPAGTVLREVDAYQITGLNFIGFGAGVNFAFHQYVGVAFELKAMIMLPTFGVVLAPTIGPVFGF